MRIFYRRPLVLAAFVYVVCSLAVLRISYGAHQRLFGILLCAFVVTSCMLFLLRRHGKREIVSLLCLFAAVLSVGSSLCLFRERYERLQTYVGQPCVAEGTVTERLTSESFFTSYRVKITGFEEEAYSFGALLECEFSCGLQVGDSFVVHATPRAFLEDELFDEKRYRLSDGCMLVLQVESEQDCTVVEEESFDLSVWASRINLKQSFRLWRTVGMRSGGLTSALLLGNRRFLSNLDQFHFRACGISHLLALSGLHVSILVAFLDRLLKLLRASKTVRAVVISLTAIGYLILTGCSVSAARAVLMACILYLAFLWRHEYDSLTALCTALMLILTVTPYAVLDVSLWLSFVAAGSIIIFYPPINRFFNKRRPQNKLLRICTRPLTWPCSAVAVGFLANVALLPLSAAFFGSFSIWSIPATLLFSFPVTLLMIGGTILLVCPYVPFLGEACAALEAFILEGAAFFARQNVTLLPLTDTRTEILLGVLSVALILLAVLKLRHRAWSLLLPLLFVAVTVLSYCAMRFPEKTDWQVTAVLQDHRGEICVYTGGGHVAVVNDTYGAVSCAQEIKKVVDDAGFTEIRDVILCNPSDQATYFIKTLAETVRVRKLYLPYPETPKDMAITEKLCEVAQSYGISVYANADEKLLEYLSPSQ